MASPALVSTTVILTQPFQLVKLVVTSGATAGDIAHSCPKEPIAVIPVAVGAIDNSNECTVVSKDGTNINLDFEDDGNNTFHIYCISAAQA